MPIRQAVCYEEIIDTLSRHSLVLFFALSFSHYVHMQRNTRPPCKLCKGVTCMHSFPQEKGDDANTQQDDRSDNSNLQNKTNFVGRFRPRVVTNRERRKSSTREEPIGLLHSSQVSS